MPVLPILTLAFALRSTAQTPAPDFETLARQAQQARDAKQLRKALDLYHQALKLQPKWDEGWWNAGSIAYDLDRYAECAPDFRRLAALKPDSAPAWTMAGLCEYKLRRYDAALESFSHVERLGYREPEELGRAARLHLALTLIKTEFFERAVTVLGELTKVDHGSPQIVVAAGIAGLRKAWLPSEVPESAQGLVMKLGDAMVSGMESDFKSATEKFEAAAREYPSEPNVYFRYGAFLNSQDPEKGIDQLKHVLTLEPEHVPALIALSAVFLKREELDTALEFGEKAVKAGPNDFATHIVLGRVLLAREQPARAAEELETAVKLGPANAEAHYNLASAYSRLGRKEDASREQGEFKRLQQPVAR